jgi:hypothetical protein
MPGSTKNEQFRNAEERPVKLRLTSPVCLAVALVALVLMLAPSAQANSAARLDPAFVAPVPRQSEAE